ncbi:ABC transporter permease [Micromonospora peucetia]|uniref:ABC transporter permease n=1 Tax=Micromonospora peucetia TaxID=47871 RepID=A0A1C6U4W0_9ACTN|nr:ABC transporter permease [Micromonospora peucetia]WSA33423.1 ABC transporter permease [Micromonospora peucetia]SCL48951.1 putative ABC transport system permease protein [Micromonospora peucetia]
MSAGRGGRLARATGSWWAALRIARREARRARGRTALVLAMITLPVLVLTFTAVSWRMSELTPAERIERQLGTADAELLWVQRQPIVQSAWGDAWHADREDVPLAGVVTADQVTTLLPAGSRVVPLRRWVSFDARVGERIENISGHAVDLADPLGRGLVRFHSGRAPTGPDEIAVSPAALRRLDVRLGGTVTSGDGIRSWRVVGVAEHPDDLGPVVTLHPTADRVETGPDTSWLVDLPGAVDEALFRRLNAHGVVVHARTPAPASDAVTFGPGDFSSVDVEGMSISVLVGGLGLLEVVLLVGPAFAVGVRRRRRELALVAVAGGDDAHLRRIVLADGVVLGALGATVGVTLGVAAAFAGRPLVEQHLYGARFGGYRCWPEALAAIAAVAVLAGVLAALAPAWTAARQDVVAGLAGRRTPPAYRRHWLAVGVALAVGGAAVAAFGAARTAPAVILAGIVLGELGLVFATPTLVGLLARLGRSLPLAPRIALRDASRNRSSTAPAISAVMAAVAGSVAIGVYLASDEARSVATYQPALPPGAVLVTDRGPDGPPALSLVAEAARAHLGARAVVPLAEADCGPKAELCAVSPVLPVERACPWAPGDQLSPAQQRQARADARCRGPEDHFGGNFHVVVDDGTALPVLTGAAPADVAAATAVLRAGGVVVTDPRYVVDGRVDVAVTSSAAATTTTVAGYPLPTGLGVDRLLLSRPAAERLGLTVRPIGWAFTADGVPDEDRENRFVAAVRPLDAQLEIERDPTGAGRPLLLLLAAAAGVITVGAAGIATGLAAAEGRADLSTLAAVGASPGLRRLLSLCQSGVIAVLGCALGIVAGLGSASIILTAVNRRYAGLWPVSEPYPMVVPWATLGVLMVVPLVAMLGAGLFTRSRLPVERRLD